MTVLSLAPDSEQLADDRRAAIRESVDRALGPYAERGVVSVDELVEILRPLGRTSVYELVRRGRVPSIKVGRRSVVPVPALVALLLGVEGD